MADRLVGRVAGGLVGRTGGQGGVRIIGQTDWLGGRRTWQRTGLRSRLRAGLAQEDCADGFVASRGVDRIADGQDGGEAYVPARC